jgi:hypothetical protein
MENGILMAHSGWRYIVIVILALAVIKALIGWLGQGRWGSLDRWLGMLTPVALDIQLLLGLILWILQQRWTGADPLDSWEHPVTMMIVVAIAHITWTRVKRAEPDTAKFRAMTIGYLIAGLILALGVARITGAV